MGLSAWITSRLEAPEEFDDARPDLYPVLRCRSYFEVDMPLSSQLAEPIDLPYEIIGEHLAAGLVYDLPQSMMSVSSDLLETWGVTFYEAMEAAKTNLAESTEGYAKIGELYAVANGDAYDATRILLTDLIEGFEVDGDQIAMVPNRHTLLVAGSNDIDSLETMLDIAEKELDHERYITGVAFRFTGSNWEPWLPSEGHKLQNRFGLLHTQAIGRNYHNQKQLLDLQHEKAGTDIFVASYSAIEDESTGRLQTYATWSKDVPTLLPKADLLILMAMNSTGTDVELVASGSWEDVERIAGHLFEKTEHYPERFFVDSFPTEEELAEIGKLDLG